ncbi:MAG TPA: TolC family protein [Dongiaceae bacterium]|nr:TolC family protein [Dongiaceae bacterium]
MRLLGILLALAGTSLTLSGQTNAVEIRKLTLEDCIQVALEHNLDVKIKRLNPRISRFTLRADYGAYDPSLSLAGEHDYSVAPGGITAQGLHYPGTEMDVNTASSTLNGMLPWGTTYRIGTQASDSYGTDQGFPFESVNGGVGLASFDQPLLKNFWIDNARLQIFLDKKNLKITELDLRAQVMNTITAVEQAYFELVFDQENVKVQRKALQLAEQLLAENRERVQVGTLAPLDEKQAESQAAGSRADLLVARGTEGVQERALEVLLSDDYSKWRNIVVQPVEPLVAVPQRFDLQESWSRGMSLRPDLLQQKLKLEQQGYTVKFQKNQLFPQLDLLGSAGYSASSTVSFDQAATQLAARDNPYWTVGGKMTFPLGGINARNTYKAGKLTKEQLGLQLKQLQQNILIQIENAIETAKTDLQRVGATREARIYAEAALDAEQKKLENGKSTSFQVLSLQRDLTTARSTEIRALADYNEALANVAVNEGTTLERRHVTLEVK